MLLNGAFMVLHPGRILLEEYLAPRGISVWHLAKDIGVSPQRLYDIVAGQRPISPDIAMRLAHYFGLSKRFWLDLQARFDREIAQGIPSGKVIDIARNRKPTLSPPTV